MPPLENAKHEQFAQALAIGKSAVDAYERAGYRRNRGHASTLRRNPQVLRRVDEILETRGQIQERGALAAIERVRLTKITVIQMLLADRERALGDGKISVAVHCAELLGIELGMFVRRSDNRHLVEKRRFSDLPPDERDREAERLITEARALIERAKAEEAAEAMMIEAEAVKVPEVG